MNTFTAPSEEWMRRLGETQADLQVRWLQQLAGCPPPTFDQFFRVLGATLLSDQEAIRALHARYYREQMALWLEVFAGARTEHGGVDDDGDPRFRAPEWREIPWFDFLRRSYRITARWLGALAEAMHADQSTRRRVRFYMRQYIAAASPSNSVWTNPDVVKLAFQSQGKSLARGLRHLRSDADKGRITMTDESAFALGTNLAITPGAVVFENALIQLIQYRPSTATAYSRPLLMVPPFINKYYVLDLQASNSFVRHALDSGVNVFMVSWRNVPPSLGNLTWDDYIEQGVIAAIEATCAITRRRKIHALGFCVGGTLLASTLAVLEARARRPVASLTLLAAMLDFCDPGDIGVYIDEDYVTRCERELGGGGLLPGSRLANAFASLRPEDLVWRYVVNNYLKGLDPPAFDLLYWNADSANLPGPLYAYYLRNMYQENSLRHPGRLTMCGAPIDLRSIDLPSYVLAAAEDHIVPWRTAYASALLLGRDVEFVRASSGHIAGVVSPPRQPRRSYRTGPLGPDADAWLESSREHDGSWWTHWLAWIARRSGKRVQAPARLGSARYPELEPAPGRYVRERTEHAHSRVSEQGIFTP